MSGERPQELMELLRALVGAWASSADSRQAEREEVAPQGVRAGMSHQLVTDDLPTAPPIASHVNVHPVVDGGRIPMGAVARGFRMSPGFGDGDD